jgi:23S rRNA (uracil1939-C5)-methyltransferase
MNDTDDIIELELDAMAHGGEAIGRHEGRTVFVSYAIPGERVRAEIVDDRKRYARARTVEVLSPSPARVDPPCPYFGPERCGGCQWQHIDYQVQARIKGLVTQDQLQRVGKFEDPPIYEPVPDPEGWEYRNHALFRLDPQGHLGFLSAQSHDVYTIDECLILHPLLSAMFEALDMTYPELEWMELRAGTATGELMMLIQAKEEESPSLQVDMPLSIVQIRHDDAIAPLIGLDYFTECVHEREFRISATSFFQVNSRQAGALVDLVMQAVAPGPEETVLDAYCGVGLFTAFLREEAGFVVGIEAHPTAVEDARHNLAGADNVEILAGPVEEVLPDLACTLHAAVVDPPRGGLEREALDALVAHAPQRIVYVSCDPATFARDARRLVRQGYELAWVQPVDLFPQTYHIENVALLTREAA